MTDDELTMLEQICAEANPNEWIDFTGNGRSHRTHIGYAANRDDGTVVNVALFETNANAKRSDILMAVYSHNYLPLLLAEIHRLREELNAAGQAMFDATGYILPSAAA